MKNIIFFACLGVVLVHVQAQALVADSLFQAENWNAAITAYQEHIQEKPADRPGFQWNRIGQCYFNLQDWKNSIDAYKKSVAYNGNTTVMYNIACGYAHISESDSAFAWLDRAAAGGFTLYKGMKDDSDLKSIRDDLRFPIAINKIKKNAEPCSFDPASHQFDFWIGKWKVFNPQGQQSGTSEVDQILGECVIFENWTDYFGNQGKSFNFYNASERKWQQTWVDDKGSVTEFYDGQYENGAMRFPTSRPVINPQTGKKIIRRLTFFNIGPDQVRQFGERSDDEGKTWQTEYDLKYIRQY